MLWSPKEILACRVLSSHFQREQDEAESRRLRCSLPKPKVGHLFIRTEPARFSDCTRIAFPRELFPHSISDPEGRPFVNNVFSNLLFPASCVTENTCPYLRNHRDARNLLPTDKFWSFRRWMRSLHSPARLSEQDEIGLMSGSAVEEQVPGSRKFVCIYNRDYKVNHLLPAYLRHLRASRVMNHARAMLASGVDVELLVPSFMSEAFSVTEDNVAGMLGARVTLSTLCTVFAGVFLLSKEYDWLKK